MYEALRLEDKTARVVVYRIPCKLRLESYIPVFACSHQQWCVTNVTYDALTSSGVLHIWIATCDVKEGKPTWVPDGPNPTNVQKMPVWRKSQGMLPVLT